MLSAPGRGDELSAPDLLRDLDELAPSRAIRIVHRLDRDASGVLLFARTLEAQRGLIRQFARREVDKTYHAIVSGYVTDDGDVNLPLAFNKRMNRMETVAARGKRSLTRYRVLDRLAGHTLLECSPATGRTHQIRAHMAAIGHPLAVDPVYGDRQELYLSSFKADYSKSRRRSERPLISRLTLHALRLTIQHPIDGTEMTFETPPPKDFRATVNQLARLV